MGSRKVPGPTGKPLTLPETEATLRTMVIKVTIRIDVRLEDHRQSGREQLRRLSMGFLGLVLI
jgi:hypothetical protein